MFYRQHKTLWNQFCNFRHFLKAENSEDSLASSCEELSIGLSCNPVWDWVTVGTTSPAFFFFFFLVFSAPSFRVFYNLLTVLRGCFTSIGLIHLSLLLSSPFFPFFSSLFFLLFSLSFLLSLPFLSLSLCRYLVRRPPPCRTASDGPAGYATVEGLCLKDFLKVYCRSHQRDYGLTHTHTPRTSDNSRDIQPATWKLTQLECLIWYRAYW